MCGDGAEASGHFVRLAAVQGEVFPRSGLPCSLLSFLLYVLCFFFFFSCVNFFGSLSLQGPTVLLLEVSESPDGVGVTDSDPGLQRYETSEQFPSPVVADDNEHSGFRSGKTNVELLW